MPVKTTGVFVEFYGLKLREFVGFVGSRVFLFLAHEEDGVLILILFIY